MKRILLLGAGRTAYYLIEYILDECASNNWKLVVADYNIDNLPEQFKNNKHLLAVQLDVNNMEKRCDLIAAANVVISLLPAHLHIVIAKDCLKFNKDLVTASYVSDEMALLDAEAQEKGLLFLNEIGLDPGIDHMSAMQILDNVRKEGGKVERFLSYTGGLMSPKLKNNPWEYKFTWNPEYVVTSGRDGGMYLRNGKIKRIPYHRLYTEIDELEMPNHGFFDAFYNRNSLKYIEQYRLKDVKTVIRYTLRRKGFCQAWQTFVNLGLTDNNFVFELDRKYTNREFLNIFIRKGEGKLEDRLAKAIKIEPDSEVMAKLKWLGVFDNKIIDLQKGTSAAFLQKILEDKWTVEENESDAIYMAHVCYYTLNQQLFKLKSYLAVEGNGPMQTAMAKTVGMPLAIAAVLILEGKIKAKGVKIPVEEKIYGPVLERLSQTGIKFYHTKEQKELESE